MKRFTIILSLIFITGCGLVDEGQEELRRADAMAKAAAEWDKNHILNDPKLDPRIKQCIQEGSICVGMTLEQAKLAWPDKEHKGWRLSSKDSFGDEIWDYGWGYQFASGPSLYHLDRVTHTFYFNNGILTHWIQWGY